MIEFFDVADLVDDHIVPKIRRQKSQLVIEVQIPLLGTAAPAALLIPDRDAADRYAMPRPIMPDEIADSFMNDRPYILLVRFIKPPTAGTVDGALEADAEYGAEVGDLHR